MSEAADGDGPRRRRRRRRGPRTADDADRDGRHPAVTRPPAPSGEALPIGRKPDLHRLARNLDREEARRRAIALKPGAADHTPARVEEPWPRPRGTTTDLPEAAVPRGRASGSPTGRHPVQSDDELAPADPTIAWGDDRDAPTPDVALAADLPDNPPADDADPASAGLFDEPAADDPFRATGPLCEAVGIKFHPAGKIVLHDADGESYRVGETVVVEGERGAPRLGQVAVAPLRQPVARGLLPRVLRRPNAADRRTLERNEGRADEILRIAKAIARDLALPIKVFRVELGLLAGRATIYFSSEEKIDFRRLLRDLGAAIHLRIELRQTGVRDEAKLIGGIGSCGLPLCCSTWLPAFVPVSIKNAKDQGLVLNPTKVSGQCGRLKCCLVYEQATYAELRKGLPRMGKRVVTADGDGRVVEVDVLRQRVRVSLAHGEFKVYGAGEVKPMFPSQPTGVRPAEPLDRDRDPEPEPS